MCELFVGESFGAVKVEDREFQNDFSVAVRGVGGRFLREVEHFVQIVHDAQRRVVFADFIEERLVGTLHVCRFEATHHQSHVMLAGGSGVGDQVDDVTRDVQIDAMHFHDFVVERHHIAVFRDIGQFSPVENLRGFVGEHVAQRGVLASGRGHEFDATAFEPGEHGPESVGDSASFVK